VTVIGADVSTEAFGVETFKSKVGESRPAEKRGIVSYYLESVISPRMFVGSLCAPR